MASRPKGYGMTAELADKRDAKYDLELAGEVMNWIKTTLTNANSSYASAINPSAVDSASVHETLKDGVILLELANALDQKKRKVNQSKMAFKMMENISSFLSACEGLGVHRTDLFQTVDLYEAQNMPQVITSLGALGRKFGLGPRESTKNVREFSEAQLKEGQNIIGLQMGSNKGATQAGQSFGKSRSILD